ncbi:MAG: alpha/beta hydrolase [Gemmataceae bacterium]
MASVAIIIGLSLLGVLIVGSVGAWVWLFYYVKHKLYPYLPRIFEEKPLFIIPRGQPIEDAEEVRFQSHDGLELVGCYFPSFTELRKGVILFGLEFGSNRWACVPYCEFLREAGFDVFTFEPRCQGDSETDETYEPLQWVTSWDIQDMQSAVTYLRSRDDSDPGGIGFFGISKGGSAGLAVAANDPYIRCFVTDGIFATYTTMVPYMRRWIQIYSHSSRRLLQRILPNWYYGMFAKMGLREVARKRNVEFPSLERALPKLGSRPWLMIHGEADSYIKVEMAEALFKLAPGPKELWLVEGAKHNQSFQIAPEEYRRRILAFFSTHLVGSSDLRSTDEVTDSTRNIGTPVTAE